MKRLTAALILVSIISLIFAARYAVTLKEQRMEVEQLLWVEFDAAMRGVIRLLHLAEASPTTAQAALLAAYEHALALRRLGPAAERLLSWRGVEAEPLAGYIMSLTGGVASICDQTRDVGHADTVWILEIRRRLEAIHNSVNAAAMRESNPKRLQQDIQQLFSSETAVYSVISAQAGGGCSF